MPILILRCVLDQRAAENRSAYIRHGAHDPRFLDTQGPGSSPRAGPSFGQARCQNLCQQPWGVSRELQKWLSSPTCTIQNFKHAQTFPKSRPESFAYSAGRQVVPWLPPAAPSEPLPDRGLCDALGAPRAASCAGPRDLRCCRSRRLSATVPCFLVGFRV